MTKKPKASIKPRSVSHPVRVIGSIITVYELGNWRVEIAGEENHQHVINEVVYIEKIFIGWIWSAIHIKALHFVISYITGEAIGGGHPQAGPGIDVAVCSEDGIPRCRINLDDIIILFVAPEISLAIRGFGAFAGVVEAPILAINKQVVEIATFRWLALCYLCVARELVAQRDESVIPLKAPRVVFERPEIESVESVRSALVCEQRIFQLGCSILRAKKEAKGMLRIGGASAEAAADAQSGIDMKALRSIRVNEFNGCGALPINAVLTGVCVNTGHRIEQVSGIRHD